MNIETSIASVLTANAPLMAVLTGGVFTSTSVGRNGISRSTLPSSAFNSSGLIKPLCVVVVSDDSPDGAVMDSNGKTLSMMALVQIRLYDDGDVGYNNIRTAADLIYGLLQYHRSVGTGFLKLIPGSVISGRDPQLNNAALEIYRYSSMRIRHT